MQFRAFVVNNIANGNGKSASDTAPKLPVPKPPRSPAAHLKAFRFVKGDKRINRSGRPRSFDELRKLAKKILHETVRTRDGETLSGAEAVLRSWATSKEPALQRALIEYGFGKVPDKIEATGLEGKTTLLLHFAHERTRGDDDRSSDAPTLPDTPPQRQPGTPLLPDSEA